LLASKDKDRLSVDLFGSLQNNNWAVFVPNRGVAGPRPDSRKMLTEVLKRCGQVRLDRAIVGRLMKWRKGNSLNDYRFIEIVSRYVGQPTVICPKCDKFISPPEQLIEHLTGCATDRRSSVLKRGPLYKSAGRLKGDDHSDP
jgi:hypothetical protein